MKNYSESFMNLKKKEKGGNILEKISFRTNGRIS